MKSYKLRFIDGKSIQVTSNEKITVKKLSAPFLSFEDSSSKSSRIYINTNHIALIEELKNTKPGREKKPKSEKAAEEILPVQNNSNLI